MIDNEKEKEQTDRIDYVNYSRAKISSIPKELLEKKDSIISLDISGNNFKDFNSVLYDLKTFKNLKKLKINIFTQEQAKHLIYSMPNLEYLNDEPISDREEEQKIINVSLIKLLDKNFKSVFKKFKEFFKLNTKRKNEYKNLLELFNNKCKELNINENKNVIEKLNDIEIKKEMELYKFISNELNKIKEEIDININNYEENSIDILINIMEENEKIKNRCNKILKERQNKKNKKALIDSGKNIKKKNIKIISPKKKTSKEKWNNKTFSKNYRNTSFRNQDNQVLFTESYNGRFSNSSRKSKKYNYSKRADLIEFYDDPFILNLLIKSRSEYDSLNIFDDENNDIIIKSKLNSKKINLNNLLDIIHQTYKIRYSRIKKQIQGVYNKGTLEQDLYLYLKSKYGLKNLIIEWNINILSSIQAYYKINGEVFLFALILKNQIDEDSIEILNRIKNTVNNILNIIYDYNINKIKKIKENKEFIDEKEWKEMCNCLYSDDNLLNQKFINEIYEFIYKLMKEKGKDLIEKAGQNILYEDFMNILIIFNMKLRKNYLHNLYILFSNEDNKRIGIINKDNFKQIIKNTEIIKDQQKLDEVTEQLIEIADKEGSGQITFSEVVQCLNNLDLITEKGKIKFLDKLSNMKF